MNGVLKRQWKTYYKKRTDVDNMQEDCVTLQGEVTKRVYFIGNERMLIAHDSNRLRFS